MKNKFQEFYMHPGLPIQILEFPFNFLSYLKLMIECKVPMTILIYIRVKPKIIWAFDAVLVLTP